MNKRPITLILIVLFIFLNLSCSKNSVSTPPPPCLDVDKCFELNNKTVDINIFTKCPKRKAWIAKNKHETRSIVFGYEKYHVNAHSRTRQRPPQIKIISAGESVEIECSWAFYSENNRDDVWVDIEQFQRCFSDSPDCTVNAGLPIERVTLPNIQNCRTECNKANSELCIDVSKGLTSSALNEINRLARHALYSSLPTNVSLDGILSSLSQNTCPPRSHITLKGNLHGQATSFESFGSHCMDAYDERPANVKLAGTHYYFKTLWVNVPQTLRGKYLRIPSSSINSQPEASLKMDKSFTVMVDAEFYDPARPNSILPDKLRYGSDRINIIDISQTNDGAKVILSGEKFLCASIDVNQ